MSAQAHPAHNSHSSVVALVTSHLFDRDQIGGSSLCGLPAVENGPGVLWEDPGVPHVVLAGLFLGVAGFAAGIIGTAGGITTLVTYPALLAVGISPLAANVTNSVAVLGSGLSSASRQPPTLRVRALPSAGGCR